MANARPAWCRAARRRLRRCGNRILGGLAIAAGLLVCAPPAVLAQPAFAPGLCVVTVRNSTLETARRLVSPGHEFGDSWWASAALAREVTMLPGLSKPILYPWFEGLHAWTVSDENGFEAFGGRFPASSLWDRFAVESGSGRIVGADSRGVYAFDPSSREFQLLVPARFGHGIGEVVSETEFRDVNSVVHIARLGLTLVGTGNGVFRLRGDRVEALPGAARREVGGIEAIIDLPVHGAMLLSGRDRAWLRHDDGTVELLTGAGGVSRAFESTRPGRIVAQNLSTLLEVEMRRGTAGFSPGRTWTLMSSSANIYPTYLVTRSGEYLILGRASWFGRPGLERLDADGLQAVPGVPVQAAERGPWLHDVPSRGLVLINGRDGLYAYDGARVTLIPGSAPGQVGPYALATDMPSIGKVVVQTDRALFELTADGQLERIRLPFDYSFVDVEIAELPAARVGLVATKDNLFALTRSGLVLPIEGGTSDRYSMAAFAGVIPVRNAMLVRGKVGLHLLTDTSQSGSVCTAPVAPKAP